MKIIKIYYLYPKFLIYYLKYKTNYKNKLFYILYYKINSKLKIKILPIKNKIILK